MVQNQVVSPIFGIRLDDRKVASFEAEDKGRQVVPPPLTLD